MVSLSASLDSLSLLVGLKWPYLSFTITGNTHALLYTHPSCPHACPALNISSILTQHSSVLPREWQRCSGSLLEDSFSSWVQLDVSLGFLGPSGLPPSSWVNKPSWVFQYKAACGSGVPPVWGAQPAHPYHSSCSSCSHTCLRICITGRRGWWNRRVPAVHRRVPAVRYGNQRKQVLRVGPGNWHLQNTSSTWIGGEPCLGTMAL